MAKKVLLAEDSVTIQKAIQMTFAAEDILLTTVSSAEEAIARAKELKPDLVIADLSMTGKNGYDVCSAVRAEPALGRTTVLLLHGSAAPLDEAKARAVGADGELSKPFESQTLIDKARALAEGRAESAPRPAAEAKGPRHKVQALAPPIQLEQEGEDVVIDTAPVPRHEEKKPVPVAKPLPAPPVPKKPPVAPPPVHTAAPHPMGHATLIGLSPDPFTAKDAAVPAAHFKAPPVRPVGPLTTPPPPTASPKAPPPVEPVRAKPFAAPPARPPATPRSKLITPPQIEVVAEPQPQETEITIEAELPPSQAREPLPSFEMSAVSSEKKPVISGAINTASAPTPIPAPAPTRPSPPSLRAVPPDEQAAYEAIAKLSREVIERIVWEVVPDLAERIIREELDRLIDKTRAR
jgi:CheY-like chemotaxis protein